MRSQAQSIRLSLCLTLLAAATASTSAQPSATPSPQSREGITLLNAQLPSRLKAQIVSDLVNRVSLEDLAAVERSIRVLPVELGSYPHPILRIWGGPPYVCGVSGDCTIALYDQTTGIVLLHGLGWKFISGHTSHNSLLDLVIQERGGSSSQYLHRYRFNGHVYKEITNNP